MKFTPARSGSGCGGRRNGPRTPAVTKTGSTAAPAPPFGDLIGTISLSELEQPASKFRESATIRNAVTVASFNWTRKTKDSKPLITIPSSPPRWRPPQGPTQLREDQGQFFRDRNAAQYPQHPMEPAIVAGLHSHPELPKDINVVACNSTLGNLLRLIRRQNKSFRILVILVDQTLFLIRRENSPTEIMQDVRGFGHTFPKAYTTWGPDVTQSESHQRLLRYAFGDLQLLVRFEADGYLPQSHDKAIQQVQSRPKTNDHFDVNILTESFKTSEILSEGDPAIVSSTSDKLDVQQAGDVVSQSSIFDLKTRIMKKKDHEILSGEIPRLWVAHISNFVVAYHERGMFKPENINIQNVSWDIAKWEKDKNSELAQLVALLHSLIYKAREKETGRFEMFKSEGGNLELRRTLADAGDALSAGVKKKWLRSSEATSMGSEKVDLKGTMTVGVLAWEDAQNSDYTACSDACNYCGSCTY